MRYLRGALILGVFAVGISAPSFSASKSYQHFALPNGLEVFVLPRADAQVVRLGVWVRAGLTVSRAASVVARTAWYPAEVSTTAEASQYEVTLAKSELEEALAHEALRMSGQNLDVDVFAQANAAQPPATIQEKLQEILLGMAPQDSPIEFSEAQAFYRSYYIPSRAFLVIAGDVSPERVMSLVRKYFGPLVQPQVALPPSAPAPLLPLSSEIQQHLSLPGSTGLASGLGFRLPAPLHGDHAAAVVTSELLAPQGIFTRAQSYSLWSLFAERSVGLTHSQWLSNFDTLVSEMDVSRIEELLALAKDRIRMRIEVERSTLAGLTRLAGEAAMICGHPVYFQQLLTRVAAVKAVDVLRILRTYFNPNQRASIFSEEESSHEFH